MDIIVERVELNWRVLFQRVGNEVIKDGKRKTRKQTKDNTVQKYCFEVFDLDGFGIEGVKRRAKGSTFTRTETAESINGTIRVGNTFRIWVRETGKAGNLVGKNI